MSNIIGLDFETYSEVDLPKHGLDRYLRGEAFTPTLACTYDEEPITGGAIEHVFDFVQDYYESAKKGLLEVIEDKIITAHNAPFEQGVLGAMGHQLPHSRFICSAVVARAAGAGGSLEAAAPQLLNTDKQISGKDGMKLFAWPGKYQEANGSPIFDPDVVAHHPAEWADYIKYCKLDAKLSWKITNDWDFLLGRHEHEYAAITHSMNDYGWHVDMAKVEEMQRRFEYNKERELEDWYARMQPDVDEDKRLNFRSFPQLQGYCLARGIKARSFDEEHVEKLLFKIIERLDKGGLTAAKDLALCEVRDMLVTKQILGGSSLSKLQKIKDLIGPDDRLRGQYLHVGAGQTLRTSGRGVQMQNLKRLTEPLDMAELEDPSTYWSNDALSVNLRQVFTASDKQGFLLVGDFASVESRGLAYLAGAEWKLDAFRQGKDMYKVLAEQMFHVHYDDVLKPQRQTGKVGELSCGYGAGGQAVKDFASKMGTQMTLAETTQLVDNWRGINPEVVNLWEILNLLLHKVVVDGQPTCGQEIGNGLRVEFFAVDTPPSLRKLAPTSQSVGMELYLGHERILTRVFHGCYLRGRNVCYFKPTERKTGDVWVNHYRHPKSGQIVFYNLYGGKLAGILTQSLCREMFFHSLKLLHTQLQAVPNMEIVGQFHDEIVVDWWRGHGQVGDKSLTRAKVLLEECMTNPGLLTGFPLAAEIKHDYRYTK